MSYSITILNNRQRDELDFIHKLLQPEVRPRIEEIINKRTSKGPLIVEFDPTTACNFTCPECISEDLLNKGQIQPERTLELITEFYNAGVKGIIFIGGGEPLAHTGMPQPIIHAYKLGISVGLTTNGSLIHRHLEAIARYVSWTRVSVDAATQTTFSLFRPSSVTNSFTKVISNMENLAKIKKGQLGFSFLLMERIEDGGSIITNCHEILKAANLARDIGCDYFEFKPMVDKHHHLVPFSQNTRDLLAEQLRELKRLSTDGFHINYPKSIEYLLISPSSDQPKKYISCPVTELRTVVTPHGIYPCPYKRGIKENLIGSPNEKFDDFWLSEERQKRMIKINPSIDCQFYCIRHDTNLLLNTLSESYSEGVNLLPYLIQTEVANDIFI